MRTHRLFTLLDLLRGAVRPVSAAVLAGRLGVSSRTLYRDMATLQGMGAPIRGEAGVGYQLEPGFFLPPLHFDPQEMEAVMLGIRMVRARADATLADAAGRASAKLGAIMKAGDGDAYLRLPLRAVSRRTEEGDRAEPHLGGLREAIRARRLLRVVYRDLKERRSERNVRPLGLTVFDEVWLLTVWCEVKSDFRNLRVDRIEDLSDMGVRFRPEKGRRFEDYLETL